MEFQSTKKPFCLNNTSYHRRSIVFTEMILYITDTILTVWQALCDRQFENRIWQDQPRITVCFISIKKH